MKYKNKILFGIICFFIINFFMIKSFAKYISNINIKVLGKIAEPIIICEKDDKISCTINKETIIPEYNFCLKNYLVYEKETKINEIDFKYNIEVINLDENFPIKYELYNVITGEKIDLVNNKTKYFNIKKGEKEDLYYKLKLNWYNKNNDLNNNYYDSIKILINVIQKE